MEGLSLAEAQDRLGHRSLRMIIELPQGFTASLSEPSSGAKIRYYLNESNPQMVSNVMQGVAAKVTAAMDAKSSAAGLEACSLP